jgi:hypothetical protein
VQVEAAHRFIETLHSLRGLDGHDAFEAAATRRRNLLAHLDELPPYRNGGFGTVPASDAMVGLQKRTFHAGRGSDVGGCAICLEDEFEEGQEVSVMSSSTAHAFHARCINVWLGQSNTCPLCILLARASLPVQMQPWVTMNRTRIDVLGLASCLLPEYVVGDRDI